MFKPIALLLFALLLVVSGCSNKLSNQITRSISERSPSDNPIAVAQTSGDTVRLDLTLSAARFAVDKDNCLVPYKTIIDLVEIEFGLMQKVTVF
jgi:hypothetical protein